jgi:hypothetical protein
VFDPSGFIMEGDQPDVFYGGESMYQLVGALAAVTDRESGAVEPDWAFLNEVVHRMATWREYQLFYDPGIYNSKPLRRNQYHAGAGFSGRTGAGVPAGQAGAFHKSITLADHFADQKFLATVETTLPDKDRMSRDINNSLEGLNADMQAGYSSEPPNWSGWSPWCKKTAYLPQKGWYTRLKTLVDAADPVTLPPVARAGTSYNRPIGGPPTGYEFWAYKNTDGSREWGFFMEAQARQGNYGGWYGGKIETFWTETTGVVLISRHGKSGSDPADKEDSSDWSNIEYRAAHHVWGRDENGKAFSTLHLRGQTLNRPVTFDTGAAVPQVRVTNMFNNPAHADTPTSMITGEQTGSELDGEVSITNTVQAYADGAQVTHRIISDGTDQVSELWVSLPVFLRLYAPDNPGDQPQKELEDTSIEYWSAGSWLPMPEDTGGDGIPEMVETGKLRLGRDFKLGDGPQYAYIVFNGSARLRLSSRIYYDPYQTKTSVRTVLVDLHGNPGTVLNMPPALTVSYRVKTNSEDNGTNSPPVIDSILPDSPLGMARGDSETFEVYASDPDGDALGYSWVLDGTGVGNNSPTFTWTAPGDSAGEHLLKVTVSDGRGGRDSQTWAITVAAAEDADKGNGDDGGGEGDESGGEDRTSLDMGCALGASGTGNAASALPYLLLVAFWALGRRRRRNRP